MKSKKIILMAVFSTLSYFGFSRILVQGNVGGIGPMVYRNHDCFRVNDQDSLDLEFMPISNADVYLGWEFLTDDLNKPFHFYAGAGGGVNGMGLGIYLDGGLNYTIKSFDRIAIEANGNLKLGYAFFFYGIENFFTQVSANIILCKPDRRGLYGGLGLTHFNSPNIEIYEGYGTVWRDINFTGLNFILGLRI